MKYFSLIKMMQILLSFIKGKKMLSFNDLPYSCVLHLMFILLFQDAHVLSSQSNEILTAIVNGMKKEEPR